MERPEALQIFRENAEEALEGRNKEHRAGLIFALGLLEQKRFLANWNEKARERLAKFKKAYDQLKEEYPEFCGLTVYGSHTKGYADSNSDFDGHIFIDTFKAFASFNPKNLTEKDFVTKEELNDLLHSQPRAFDFETKKRYAVSEAVLLKYNRAANHFFEEHGLEHVVGDKRLEIALIDEPFVKDCSASDKDIDYRSDHILALFNLSLDRDINHLRRIVINELLSEGQKGSQKWEKLMSDLAITERLEDGQHELVNSETHPQRYKNIYPTLDKASQYFLQEK